MASMVLAGGAVGSVLGGYLSDWLVRRTGDRRWTRRGIGGCAFASAALAMFGSVHFDEPWLAAGCATYACMAIHMHVAAWWGVVTEISGKHLGALFGLMNSMGVPGAVVSQIFLGRFVDVIEALGYVGRDRWDPAFYIYGTILLIGAVCWLFVDAARSAVLDPQRT
jgi:MFS family permease